jgi:hypothetical protein
VVAGDLALRIEEISSTRKASRWASIRGSERLALPTVELLVDSVVLAKSPAAIFRSVRLSATQAFSTLLLVIVPHPFGVCPAVLRQSTRGELAPSKLESRGITSAHSGIDAVVRATWRSSQYSKQSRRMRVASRQAKSKRLESNSTRTSAAITSRLTRWDAPERTSPHIPGRQRP